VISKLKAKLDAAFIRSSIYHLSIGMLGFF